MKKLLLTSGTCLLAICAALPVWGHHSMAGFDRNKTVSLNGTIKQFKWANPHSWIEMEVPNDKGGTAIWNVEMTSPAVLIRAGWKSSTLKAGDKATVNVHPLQNGDPGGIFVSVKTADGQTLTDRPAQAAAPKQ